MMLTSVTLTNICVYIYKKIVRDVTHNIDIFIISLFSFYLSICIYNFLLYRRKIRRSKFLLL